jgi:hypothetical protein
LLPACLLGRRIGLLHKWRWKLVHRRYARMATMKSLRTIARQMGITGRSGLRAACSLGPDPGSTGHMDFTDTWITISIIGMDIMVLCRRVENTRQITARNFTARRCMTNTGTKLPTVTGRLGTQLS